MTFYFVIQNKYHIQINQRIFHPKLLEFVLIGYKKHSLIFGQMCDKHQTFFFLFGSVGHTGVNGKSVRQGNGNGLVFGARAEAERGK